jgi:xylan 1,4-beta-xylosidase
MPNEERPLTIPNTAPGRRELLRSLALGMAGGSLVLPTAGWAAAPPPAPASPACPPAWPGWRSTFEGQRRADLGDGYFLNPIVPGDHPDPTILKDGDDYYMTFSAFNYCPGIVIWHSRDLVNWTPVGPALKKWIGSIFAVDLLKHQGRYYIYIPALGLEFKPDGRIGSAPGLPGLTIYVIHADNIRGPWSDPIDMKIGGAIDPGHVAGDDGKRYLFVNDGRRIRITDDGFAADGKMERVYSGWKYPQDWVVEGYSLEGPKMLRKDGWFYMFSAVGGTAGPPTSHMVIVARSRSIHGPWEDCPSNPIVHTESASSRWWSRGHATPVQGPAGDWWMVYHGIENGYRTLGRQTLLDPMEWTKDGWPKATGGDLAYPLAKPRGGPANEIAGQPLSDDFSKNTLGTRLAFFSPGDNYLDRASYGADGLVVKGRGTGAADSSPLSFIVGDHSYEVRVEVEVRGSAQAGLLLFYAPRWFCGLGYDANRGYFYLTGALPSWAPAPPAIGKRFHLKVVNNENVASFFYSLDGKTWTLHSSAEVAGYNHNVADGFLSLRPALYVAGEGEARFRNLQYKAWDADFPPPAGK